MPASATRLQIAVLTIASMAWTASLAYAQAGLQTQAFSRWKIQDQCLAQSVTHFPDHDPKSLSKRDDFVDSCLAQHNLPPRARLTPKAAPATSANP